MSVYEDTALAGKLSDEQLDQLIAAFVKNSDVIEIAHALDLPRELVLAALEDGTIAERALATKRNAAALRFMGSAIDQLQTVLELPMAMSSPAEKVQAIKLLRDLLGLRPAGQRLDRPAPKAKDKTSDKPKGGALEAALSGGDDDEVDEY